MAKKKAKKAKKPASRKPAPAVDTEPALTGAELSSSVQKPRVGDNLPIRLLTSIVDPPVFGGIKGTGMPPAYRNSAHLKVEGFTITDPNGQPVKPKSMLTGSNEWLRPACIAALEGDYTFACTVTQISTGNKYDCRRVISVIAA